MLLIPVYIDMMDIEILGLMAVFKYDDIQLDNEENMLILETIAGSIAPVLNNLVQIIDEEGSLFKSSEIIDSLKESFSKLYPFSSNNIFIIENIDDRELEERIEKYTKGKKLFIRKMKLGTDFKSFAEFFNLYR